MPEEYVIIRDWGLEEEENEGLLSPVSKSPLEALNNLEAEHVSLEEGDLEEVSREKSVIGIAPNMPLKLIEPVSTEDEESIEAEAVTNTWGIEAVRAHESRFDGSGIKVAVLDTGIDLNHPAFAGMNIKYKNFTDGTDDDVNGHGTHCAGTIFGQDVSDKRIGVARGIDEAIVGKVLGPGGGQSNQLVDAMIWAAKNGAYIISMSLGIDFTGMVEKRVARGIKRPAAISMSLEGYSANVQLFSTLIDMMENRFPNVLVVAASGNDSERPSYKIAVSPPAAGKGILSVGALRKTGGKLAVASFSNDNVDLSAPGKSIESARSGGGLKKLNGTSMATPHVAGVAALWAQKEKEDIGADPNKSTIVAMLRANATRNDFVAGSNIRDIGRGIVQAPID